MMEFEKFVWSLKRTLRHIRKPIVLFYGGGYDSQLLLAALLKCRKTFTVVHVFQSVIEKDNKLAKRKIKAVSKMFPRLSWVFLRADPEKRDKKTFNVWSEGGLSMERLPVGFSTKDYNIITGHKLEEPSIVKAFEKGAFTDYVSPLLRFSQEWVDRLYDDMVETTSFGKQLECNVWSDSG